MIQVHWLRVILDEGHKVGGVALTNKLAMAANLRAERRWVVTGRVLSTCPHFGTSVAARRPLCPCGADQQAGNGGGLAHRVLQGSCSCMVSHPAVVCAPC